MRTKIYIANFIEILNYRHIILYVDPEVSFDELYSALVRDNVNHLYSFPTVLRNRLFYIENCDLQSITISRVRNDLLFLLGHGYSVVHLKKDESGFYIVVPDIEPLIQSI